MSATPGRGSDGSRPRPGVVRARVAPVVALAVAGAAMLLVAALRGPWAAAPLSVLAALAAGCARPLDRRMWWAKASAVVIVGVHGVLLLFSVAGWLIGSPAPVAQIVALLG